MTEADMTMPQDSQPVVAVDNTWSFESIRAKIQELPRADKYRLVQFLVTDLARDECLTLVEPGGAYPIWSPYESFEAANVLHQLLTDEKGRE
jgi:hypothetical protein